MHAWLTPIDDWLVDGPAQTACDLARDLLGASQFSLARAAMHAFLVLSLLPVVNEEGARMPHPIFALGMGTIWVLSLQLIKRNEAEHERLRSFTSISLLRLKLEGLRHIGIVLGGALALLVALAYLRRPEKALEAWMTALPVWCMISSNFFQSCSDRPSRMKRANAPAFAGA